MLRRPARASFASARALGATVTRAKLRVRRRRVLLSLRAQALWLRAAVSCDVAPDVVLGRRLRITVSPHTSSVVRIGPLCRFGDDVCVNLRGGELLVGRAVELRPGCLLEVAGRLEIQGPNLVQRLCSVHCDESVHVGPHAVLSEQVTLVDSTHPADGESAWFVDDLRTAPVVVGAHAWLGAKATVGRGVRIGERAVVSANSLVVRDVPDGWLASGVPAEALRQATGPRRSTAAPVRSVRPAAGGGTER